MATNGKAAQFEYVGDVYSVTAKPKVNDGLAQRAADGWELFSVTPCWLGSTNADTREIQNLFIWRRAVT